MFICTKISRCATAMLTVTLNSAKKLVFFCVCKRHNLTNSTLQLSGVREKGNSSTSCSHALSLFPEIINFYYETVTI